MTEKFDTRFKKFGTVSYTSVTRTNDFIGYLEKGKVMGTKCVKCGAVYFPPRSDCCRCLESDTDWFEVSGAGILLSFSELRYGPAGFENELPYIIGLLDYGDYRVFGRVGKDLRYDNLSVGMKLKVESLMLPTGRISYVFSRV